MNETTKEIFEKYQIRKTKKQKTAFIEYVKGIAEEKGYDVKVEKGYLGARNIVVGNPDEANVLYTAHYDTCARLPFPNFITPKNFALYLLFQIAIVLIAICVLFILEFGIGLIIGYFENILYEKIVIDETFDLVAYNLDEVLFMALVILMMVGPANKNTANDNTSGVTTLIDIMNELSDEQKGKAAFVFFDMEETGLWGSAGFVSKHKKQIKDKLVINFDCVSDGENILLAAKKNKESGKDYVPLLEKVFVSNDDVNVEIATKGVFYPSDNMNFPCGVGVAALNKTKKLGILYMDKIHTKKDTVYRQENIDYLKACSVKLLDEF